jgi:pyruvate dehydrogenase E2 component (dihydrolipoamide acetyltransferase)
MITKMVMPQLSLSMRTGIVNRWFKQEGEFVRKGEPICELEADKAVTEIESPVSGFIKKILAHEGEEFPVREVMVYIGEEQDTLEEEQAATGQGILLQTTSSMVVNTDSGVSRKPGKILASPVAKRLAAELGIDLGTVTGTGPDGLIGKEDVLAAQNDAQKQSAAKETVLPGQTITELQGIKKLVAERMQESYRNIPHIHLSLTCNLSKLTALRQKYNEKNIQSTHITYTDILVWACGRALIENRLLNSSFQDGKIVTYSDINIGIAVATKMGLVVPVLHGADRLTLPDIAMIRNELVGRSTRGSQTPQDLQGGTFTISNLGMFAVDQFTAIINPGQAAILSVGRINPSPVADKDGGIAVQPVITLTLACDHRVVDGADGGRFLAAIQANLEGSDGMFPAFA